MKLAIILQLLLLVYHQLTTLFDFYPFNGVRFSKPKERYLEAGINFVLTALPPVGFVLGVTPLIRFGAVFYFILFLCEIATWFVPYVFGGSPKWEQIYSRVHGRTVSLLPERGPNPRPNLEHLILMFLTVTTGAASFAAYRSLPGASAHGWPFAAGLLVFMLSGIVMTHWKLPAKSS